MDQIELHKKIRDLLNFRIKKLQKLNKDIGNNKNLTMENYEIKNLIVDIKDNLKFLLSNF